MNNSEINYDWIASLIMITTIIVTIVIYFITVKRENERRLTDNFNKIYYLTFGLRKRMHDLYCDYLPNGEFFYETDIILDNEDIRNSVLDYLTEIEALLFSVIGKGFVSSSFEKMMSLALYERLSSLYGFIIKMRMTNHKKSFANFENTLCKIEHMKKFTMQKKDICYVGIRCSDIVASKLFFNDSIALFSDKTSHLFSVRPNQNMLPKEYLPYLQNEMKRIININKNQKFIFYNQMQSYRLPDDLQKHVICRNNQNILGLLNDKSSCKILLINHDIPVIPFESITGEQILQKIHNNTFDFSKDYVLQDTHGGGGVGTFLFNEDTQKNIIEQLIPLKTYLISDYIQNSISVNTHVFIAEKQTVLSPVSIQIVEIINNQLCYRGADFSAAQNLPLEIKNEIKRLSFLIANLLRQQGYRGVAGLDFLIDKNEKVYCTEINPRFQASTILLDKYLAEKNKNTNLAHSVYELNEQSFSNNMKCDLCFGDKIDLSCYYYYKDGNPIAYYKKKMEIYKQNNVYVDSDGLDFSRQSFDDNSYLFRVVFDGPICGISPDHELWINDNIKISPKPDSLLQLKIALLNQGVSIANPDERIKKGVYESVDIIYRGYLSNNFDVDINCAYGIHHAEYSPYVLDCSTKRILYFDEDLGEFTIEHDLLQALSATSRKILYLATDRLRIKMIDGCEYKNYGIGCAFCNVPFSEKRFDVTEIINALDELKQLNLQYEHILIGGGTCLDSRIWEEIAKLASFLQTDEYYKNKPISLMSVLPPINVLTTLQAAGITEVAFNMEIVNDNYGKSLLPGKWRGKKVFYETMEEAVKIFGAKSVRTALVVGIDKKEELIKEIRTLANKNILPCLSPLRALPNTVMENTIPPTNYYLNYIYIKANKIITKSTGNIKRLGPLCNRCGNNILIL